MKKLLITILCLTGLSLTFYAQQPRNNPIIIIDGEVSDTDINSLDPNNIYSITVLKGQSAVNEYGQSAHNGVILVKTKDNKKPVATQLKPLIILNGKTYKGTLEFLDHNEIKSIQVLKGDSAIKSYGMDAKNGVIAISTK